MSNQGPSTSVPSTETNPPAPVAKNGPPPAPVAKNGPPPAPVAKNGPPPPPGKNGPKKRTNISPLNLYPRDMRINWLSDKDGLNLDELRLESVEKKEEYRQKAVNLFKDLFAQNEIIIAEFIKDIDNKVKGFHGWVNDKNGLEHCVKHLEAAEPIWKQRAETLKKAFKNSTKESKKRDEDIKQLEKRCKSIRDEIEKLEQQKALTISQDEALTKQLKALGSDTENDEKQNELEELERKKRLNAEEHNRIIDTIDKLNVELKRKIGEIKSLKDKFDGKASLMKADAYHRQYQRALKLYNSASSQEDKNRACAQLAEIIRKSRNFQGNILSLTEDLKSAKIKVKLALEPLTNRLNVIRNKVDRLKTTLWINRFKATQAAQRALVEANLIKAQEQLENPPEPIADEKDAIEKAKIYLGECQDKADQREVIKNAFSFAAEFTEPKSAAEPKAVKNKKQRDTAGMKRGVNPTTPEFNIRFLPHKPAVFNLAAFFSLNLEMHAEFMNDEEGLIKLMHVINGVARSKEQVNFNLLIDVATGRLARRTTKDGEIQYISSLLELFNEETTVTDESIKPDYQAWLTLSHKLCDSIGDGPTAFKDANEFEQYNAQRGIKIEGTPTILPKKRKYYDYIRTINTDNLTMGEWLRFAHFFARKENEFIKPEDGTVKTKELDERIQAVFNSTNMTYSDFIAIASGHLQRSNDTYAPEDNRLTLVDDVQQVGAPIHENDYMQQKKAEKEKAEKEKAEREKAEKEKAEKEKAEKEKAEKEKAENEKDASKESSESQADVSSLIEKLNTLDINVPENKKLVESINDMLTGLSGMSLNDKPTTQSPPSTTGGQNVPTNAPKDSPANAMNVPGDGDCLLWATTMAYLLPVIQYKQTFKERYQLLFGNSEEMNAQFNDIYQLFSDPSKLTKEALPSSILAKPVRINLRTRLYDQVLRDYQTNEESKKDYINVFGTEEKFINYCNKMKDHSAIENNLSANRSTDQAIGSTIEERQVLANMLNARFIIDSKVLVAERKIETTKRYKCGEKGKPKIHLIHEGLIAGQGAEDDNGHYKYYVTNIADTHINILDRYPEATLMDALEAGSPELAQALLEADPKPSLDAKNQDGYTALHLAAALNLPDMVKLLLSKNPDVNATCNNGYTPLIIAAASGHLEVAKELLNANPKPDLEVKEKVYGATALHMAISCGCSDSVEALLTAGADINAADNSGWTPLMHALDSGPFGMAENLLKANPKLSLDAKNQDGYTALHIAATHNLPNDVKLLLSKNADVNATDNKGFTPLMIAAASGHLQVVKELLKANPKPNLEAKDKPDGNTALHLAISNGHSQVTKILLQSNPKPIVDAKNKRGSPALPLAAGLGLSDIVEALLNAGADINITDNQGRTPLVFAENENYRNSKIQDLQRGSMSRNTKPHKPLSAFAQMELLRISQDVNNGFTKAGRLLRDAAAKKSTAVAQKSTASAQTSGHNAERGILNMFRSMFVSSPSEKPSPAPTAQTKDNKSMLRQ